MIAVEAPGWLVAIAACAALIGPAGCGDGSKACGPGTIDENGYCVPETTTPDCTDGTRLNPLTNACEIDPASCQDGTVLINNRCQDPTAGLVVDLQEADEPNGLSVENIEFSQVPAGLIALKPLGSAFVIRGHITPFQDGDGDGQLDPDFDSYLLTVTQPTLLRVSVDGVNGLIGGFVAISDGNLPAIQSWRRFGLSIAGDTAKRQLYLPAPGTYVIAIADTRSLSFDVSSPPIAGDGAAGGPNAEYYASIEVLPIPGPTALAVTNGMAATTGTIGVEDTRFFTVAMGLGFNRVALDMPSTFANAALVVARNGTARRLADEQDPAVVAVGGYKPTDSSLIVVDTTYAYGPAPESFTLEVRIGDATPLCPTSCANAPVVANQTLISTDPVDGGTTYDPQLFNAFFYDVVTSDEIDGVHLSWNVPIQGVLLDSDGLVAANFSFDPDAGFDASWDEYRGLIRHRQPGRYYFLVFDPTGNPGSDTITATTRLTARAATVITAGTVTAPQSVDPFESNVLRYSVGTDNWHQFNGSGTNTGDLTVAFFDPVTAYGRLDALTTSNPAPPDVSPIFTRLIPQVGAETGRITLNDGTSDYLVTVNTELVASSPSFTLDFRRRDHDDQGTPSSFTVNTTLDDTSHSVRRFLFRATTGSQLMMNVTTTAGAIDPVIATLTADEIDVVVQDAAGLGAAETLAISQGPTGYTGLVIRSAVPISGTADVTLTVTVTPGS